jgi:hypothetical protein
MNVLQDIERSIIKLKSETLSIRTELKFRKLLDAIKGGFDPSQPRDDLGRWSDGADNLSPSGFADQQVAAKGTEAACEAQYKLDSAICRIVQSALCWQRAMARRAACVSGYPLPPLNF